MLRNRFSSSSSNRQHLTSVIMLDIASADAIKNANSIKQTKQHETKIKNAWNVEMSVKIGQQSCSNSHQVIVIPKIDFSTQSTRKVTFQFQNYSEIFKKVIFCRLKTSPIVLLYAG